MSFNKVIRLYRGEIRKSEAAGKDKNIPRMKQINDVIDNLSDEAVLKRYSKIKEDILKQIKEVKKDGNRTALGFLNDYLNHANIMIENTQNSIREKQELEYIANKYSYLIYLTSQKETAIKYATQLEGKNEMLFTKPEGYNPVIREFECTFDKILDLSNYKKGYMNVKEVENLLKSIGCSEGHVDDIFSRENIDEWDLPVFRLFRGKNLPIIMEYMKDKEYDAIHYMEGKQDNFIILNKNKIKEIRCYSALKKSKTLSL